MTKTSFNHVLAIKKMTKTPSNAIYIYQPLAVVQVSITLSPSTA